MALELNDLMLLGVLFSITSAVFSYIMVNILQDKREFRLTEVEEKVESLIKSKYNLASQDARAENKAFVAEAEQKIMALLAKGINKDNVMEVAPYAPALPAILKKYSKGL